jgi:hypothetical protein
MNAEVAGYEFKDFLNLIPNNWKKLDVAEVIFNFVQNLSLTAQTRPKKFQVFNLLEQ